MPPSTWKKIELQICRLFGGVRAGKEGMMGADCKGTGNFSIQVKHRKVPAWLTDSMEQCKRDAKYYELAVLALHPKGKNIDRTLIIIELEDFKEWYI